MERETFRRFYLRLFKMSTSLDIEAGQLNYLSLVSRVIINVTLVISTCWCLTGGDLGQDAFAKSKDLITLFIFLSNQAWLLINYRCISALVQFLLEPLKHCHVSSTHIKLLEKYSIKTNKIVKFGLWYIAVTGVLWAFTPIGFLLDFEKAETQKYLHLPVGWIPRPSHSQLVLTFTVVFAVSASVFNLATFYCWTLTVVLTTLKIKLKLKLLRADFSTIEERAALAAGTDGKRNVFSPLSNSETVLTKDGKYITKIRRNTIHCLHDIEMVEDELGFQDCREEAVQQNLTMCLNEAVKKHSEILKYVRLLNDSYKVSMLIYTQIGILIAALAVPKISSITTLASMQFLHRTIEVTGILLFTAMFCYCGQIILNQSEKLRFALYDCDWLRKHPEFNKHFLIMQIAATKPLRITAGGIYTLSLETYTTILSAAYSYASLLQSLNNEDV